MAWPAGRTAPQKQRLETRWHKPHTKALPLFCFSTAIASSPVFRQACLSSSSHTSLLPPAEGQLQSELCMSPGLALFLLSHFPASSHIVPTVKGPVSKALKEPTGATTVEFKKAASSTLSELESNTLSMQLRKFKTSVVWTAEC